MRRDERTQPDLRVFLEQDVLPRLSADTLYAGVDFSRRQGRYWRGACPLHGGDNPTAFSVDTQTLAWRCFSRCGGGSALAFVNGGPAPAGREFVEAVRRLADLAGVPFPERDLAPDGVTRAQEWERRSSLLETFLGYAQAALWSDDGAAARAYLVDRGFPRAALPELDFGLYTDPLDVELHLLEAGFTADEVEDAGLVSPAWRGRLVGPWRTRWGRLGTLYARDLSGTAQEGAKYLYLRGGSKRDLVALGLDVALKTETGRRDLVLVEGLLDVALLQALGFPNVAAIGGSGREISAGRFEALARFGVRSVTLVLDNDRAGREGTLAALQSAHEAVSGCPTVYVVDPAALGEAKDPDELVRRHGLEALRAVLAMRLPATVYYGCTLLDDVTPASPDHARREATHRVLEYVAGLADEDAALDAEDILTAAAARTGYTLQALSRLAAERMERRQREEVARRLDRVLQEALEARREGVEPLEVLHRLAATVAQLQEAMRPSIRRPGA